MNKIYLGVSIVINIDNDEQIKNILSKINQIRFNHEIIVVDNGQRYRSYIKKYKNTKYIFNNKHIGYAKAHNLAIKMISDKSNIHLITNVDIDFKKEEIEKMILYFIEKKEMGLLGPKIINSDGSIYDSVKYFPKPYHLLVRKFFKNKFDQFLKNYIINNQKINKEIECNFISGCFLLFKTDILKKINLFDQNYFLFNDDLDICRKTKIISKVFYNPNFSVAHDHGRAHEGSLKLTMISIKSTVYYFFKWGWFFDKDRTKYNKRLKFLISKNEK